MAITFEEIQYAARNKVFTPPKPREKIDAKEVGLVAELDSQENLIIMKKDDGNGHIIIRGTRAFDIYTLGLNVATLKYPHLQHDLAKLRFPDKTIICNEISYMVKGVQDRYAIGRITTSAIENALELQVTLGGRPMMSLFNPLMWNGEDTSNWSNHDRYQCLVEHFGNKHADHVQVTEVVKASLAEARLLAQNQKWEGLVVYDKNAPTQFKIGQVGGKRPDIPRPYGAWKDKEGLEVDFVAYDFVPSTAAAHAGGVKDFYIGLIDPSDGKIIPCGKCGNGLSREERFALAKPGALPVAVEVRFEQWSKHGKTLLGKVHRIRDAADKHYLQCVATEEQMQEFLCKDRVKPTW